VSTNVVALPADGNPRFTAELTRYNVAKKALAEAIRVDEVKLIRDQAMGLRLYAAQAKDRALLDMATEIRLLAERRCGALLRDMAASGERAVRKNMKSQATTSKLSDLGVTKSQSSQWQRLADLEDDDFEAMVAVAKHKATGGIDRAQQPKRKPTKRKSKPPPRPEAHDVVGVCVHEVGLVVRAAIAKLGDKDLRAALAEQLSTALGALFAEALEVADPRYDTPDQADTPDQIDEERWIEE
jgi:hypothetical protein